MSRALLELLVHQSAAGGDRSVTVRLASHHQPTSHGMIDSWSHHASFGKGLEWSYVTSGSLSRAILKDFVRSEFFVFFGSRLIAANIPQFYIITH